MKIVLRVEPTGPRQSEVTHSETARTAETQPEPVLDQSLCQIQEAQPPAAVESVDRAVRTESREPQPIPARMLNEFVYCQRLFYYEFVEGVFVESVDTLRGDVIHQRVDSGKGDLPPARGSRREQARTSSITEPTNSENQSRVISTATKEEESSIANQKSKIENEVIHSRSVQMGSDRLGVVAKMDLVEVRAAPATIPTVESSESGDLFTAALEVCPVDYKAGAPKEGEAANELWDTDKMQLGLQALILSMERFAIIARC